MMPLLLLRKERVNLKMNKIIHFLYSLYNPYPCGRTKADSYLCCKRKMNKWNSYLTKDKRECYCRFCNTIKLSSTRPIDFKKPLW